MQIESIAECSKREHSAILLTFIKLPIVIKIFVLSIFEWPFYTGLTVPSLLVASPPSASLSGGTLLGADINTRQKIEYQIHLNQPTMPVLFVKILTQL